MPPKIRQCSPASCFCARWWHMRVQWGRSALVMRDVAKGSPIGCLERRLVSWRYVDGNDVTGFKIVCCCWQSIFKTLIIAVMERSNSPSPLGPASGSELCMWLPRKMEAPQAHGRRDLFTNCSWSVRVLERVFSSSTAVCPNLPAEMHERTLVWLPWGPLKIC